MLALGLQGSPRKKGNSDILLTRFMDALAGQGATTRIIELSRRHIEPCRELIVCEKKGFCPIKDDMGQEIYALLRKADIVVAATPVFFYGVSAQLKSLIDRCQTLWARRYKLKLDDPGSKIRRGFVLAVGATSGKQLFDGIHLTAKYFFDGISASYTGSLTYRRIEGRGQIENQSGLSEDITRAAAQLMDGLTGRPKVLYVCADNACRSQMAAAFTRHYAGHYLDVDRAGFQPADQVDPLMVTVMQEKRVDMGFCTTQSVTAAIADHHPDHLVTLGWNEAVPEPAGTTWLNWDVPDPAGQSIEAMRRVRDDIERRVKAYIGRLITPAGR
jgi:arsenite transporter/arsenate reductase (thioredoxin)